MCRWGETLPQEYITRRRNVGTILNNNHNRAPPRYRPICMLEVLFVAQSPLVFSR